MQKHKLHLASNLQKDPTSVSKHGVDTPFPQMCAENVPSKRRSAVTLLDSKHGTSWYHTTAVFCSKLKSVKTSLCGTWDQRFLWTILIMHIWSLHPKLPRSTSAPPRFPLLANGKTPVHLKTLLYTHTNHEHERDNPIQGPALFTGFQFVCVQQGRLTKLFLSPAASHPHRGELPQEGGGKVCECVFAEREKSNGCGGGKKEKKKSCAFGP